MNGEKCDYEGLLVKVWEENGSWQHQVLDKQSGATINGHNYVDLAQAKDYAFRDANEYLKTHHPTRVLGGKPLIWSAVQ